PGVAVFKNLSSRSKGYQSVALVVGSPLASPWWRKSLPPLPHAELEARMVSRMLNTSPLVGSDATLPAVERALHQATVFHFAGHAVTTSSFSGLLLSAPNSDGPM